MPTSFLDNPTYEFTFDHKTVFPGHYFEEKTAVFKEKVSENEEIVHIRHYLLSPLPYTAKENEPILDVFPGMQWVTNDKTAIRHLSIDKKWIANNPYLPFAHAKFMYRNEENEYAVQVSYHYNRKVIPPFLADIKSRGLSHQS